MVLKLRLANMGKRRSPFYNIVVAHARTARDSLPLEVLGTYNPIPKTPPRHPTHYNHGLLMSRHSDEPTELEDYGKNQQYKDLQIDISRAKYWIGVGAQPSETVAKILCMVGVLEPSKKMLRFGTAVKEAKILPKDDAKV